MNGNGGVTKPIAVRMGRNKDNLSISRTDQYSIQSISMESTLNPDSVTFQDSDSDTVSFYTAKSVNDPRAEHQCQQGPLPGLMPIVHPASVPSAPPPAFMPNVRPASIPSTSLQAFLPIFRPVSVPSATPPEIPPTRPASVLPHLLDASESTMPVHASSSAEMV